MDPEFTSVLRAVPDDELLRRLAELVSSSRRVEADLVAHIGEVDERRLFARRAFPSMFAYCTEHLHLSEAEAYRRITVARAAGRYPAILERLRAGRLHLSGLARLVPLLTAQNADALLERATHLTTRQIEVLVAELSPRPDVPAAIRKLPQKQRRHLPASAEGASFPSATELVPGRLEARVTTLPAKLVPGRVEPMAMALAPDELVARRVEGTAPVLRTAPVERALPSRPAVQPLSPGRFKVQFTASAALRDKLERLTALLSQEVSDGDLGAVVEIAVTRTLERLEARRFGKTRAPRTTLAAADTSRASRHIPAAVRRAVGERDGERCRFVDEAGRRCSEQHRLEFHHRHPFAFGGDHRTDNIRLLCPQHNRLLAENDYGRALIRRRIDENRGPEQARSRPATNPNEA